MEEWDAAALVEQSAGEGRDEEIAALLRDRIDPDVWKSDPVAVTALAAVLERQGRVDEAADLLEFHADLGAVFLVDHHDELARLLVRHGRTERLRALIGGCGGAEAAAAAAGETARRGDVDGAVELLRPYPDHDQAAELLAQLLDLRGPGVGLTGE